MLEIEKRVLYQISETEFSWRYATGEVLLVYSDLQYRESGEIFYLYVTAWNYEEAIRSKLQILLENGYDLGSGQEFYLGKSLFCAMIEEGVLSVLEWMVPYYKKIQCREGNPYLEAVGFTRRELTKEEIKERKKQMLHILLKNNIDIEKLHEKNQQNQNIFDIMKVCKEEELKYIFEEYVPNFPKEIQNKYKQMKLQALF